jgi:hypothetical protein
LSAWRGEKPRSPPGPTLDTTSDHRARNGQITRGLRAGRRRYLTDCNSTGDCRGRHQVAFGERHAVTTTMAAEARTAPPQRLRADDPALRAGVHAHLCAADRCVAQLAQEKGLLPAERLADCCAPRLWRAAVRLWSEVRDEPGRTRPDDAWYVRSRFASFPKPVEEKHVAPEDHRYQSLLRTPRVRPAA